MKKKTVLIVVLVLALLGLACGKGERVRGPSGRTPSPTPAAEALP